MVTHGRDCGVLLVHGGRGSDCGRRGRRAMCDRYRMCILARMLRIHFVTRQCCRKVRVLVCSPVGLAVRKPWRM